MQSTETEELLLGRFAEKYVSWIPPRSATNGATLLVIAAIGEISCFSALTGQTKSSYAICASAVARLPARGSHTSESRHLSRRPVFLLWEKVRTPRCAGSDASRL